MSENSEHPQHAGPNGLPPKRKKQRGTTPPRYSLIIQWSDEDNLYIVSFPEWEATGDYALHTHGKTYAEAAESGQEVLDDILDLAQGRGWPIPEPRTYVGPGEPSEQATAQPS